MWISAGGFWSAPGRQKKASPGASTSAGEHQGRGYWRGGAGVDFCSKATSRAFPRRGSFFCDERGIAPTGEDHVALGEYGLVLAPELRWAAAMHPGAKAAAY